MPYAGDRAALYEQSAAGGQGASAYDRNGAMPPTPHFATLAMMHAQALEKAQQSDDPLDAQQYRDLAQCYASAIADLDATGSAIVPDFDASALPWRSVPLRS